MHISSSERAAEGRDRLPFTAAPPAQGEGPEGHGGRRSVVGEALGLNGIYVEKPDEIGAALDETFAHDGPSVVEVRIDDSATPIHSFKCRMREDEDKARPRPGMVYKLRAWRVSPEL
ncbi:hypothetical protein [Tritonibacter mobilis]|uniref:hypothetical protein n=1 Tax=Tritonibacter mobilis TaxID=379347 RepID=UPI001F466CBF|nr:hypothetical protein [Tritonibacter mobilis]